MGPQDEHSLILLDKEYKEKTILLKIIEINFGLLQSKTKSFINILTLKADRSFKLPPPLRLVRALSNIKRA